jgi:hypothetical protein
MLNGIYLKAKILDYTVYKLSIFEDYPSFPVWSELDPFFSKV